MTEEKLEKIKKLKTKWIRRWRLGGWKVDVELERGPNKTIELNAYCLIDWPARHAVLQIDPRYPEHLLEYIVGHELGHLIVYPIYNLVQSVAPRDLTESKIFEDALNTAEDEVIDHILRAAWRIGETIDLKAHIVRAEEEKNEHT